MATDRFGGTIQESSSRDRFGGFLLADEDELTQPSTAEFGSMGSPAEIPGQELTGGMGVQMPQPEPEPGPMGGMFDVDNSAIVSAGKEVVGAAETALTMGTAASTGIVGGIAGFLHSVAKEIESGQIGTADAANRIREIAMREQQRSTYQPKTDEAQLNLQALGEMAEPLAQLPPVLPTNLTQAALRVPGGMLPEVARQGIGAGRGVADAVMPATRSALSGSRELVAAGGREVAEFGSMGKSLATTGAREVAESIPGQVVGKAVGAGREAIQNRGIRNDADEVKLLRDSPTSGENATKRIVGDLGRERVINDDLGGAVVDAGLPAPLVSLTKNASLADNIKQVQMLSIVKRSGDDFVFADETRVAKILGNALDDRVSTLVKIRKKSGADLDRIVETDLKNSTADIQDAMNTFATRLQKLNVKVVRGKDGRLRADLEGSRVELDGQSQALLDLMLRRLDGPEGSPVKTAQELHDLKQFITSNLYWGKKKTDNALQADTENVVKKLRHDINQAIRGISDDYAYANDRYGDATNALDDLQKSMGSKVDFDSGNAAEALGQAGRRLIGNAASRIPMRDAIAKSEDVGRRYGYNFDDDIRNLSLTADELEKYFGTSGRTSFQTQTKRGNTQTGAEAAGIAANLARGDAVGASISMTQKALKAASKEVDARKVAIDAYDALLKREIAEKQAKRKANTLPVAR